MKKEDKKDETSMEELIEQKRAQLSVKNLTPVTLHSFVAWKKRKLREKAAAELKASKKKQEKMKAGFTLGISGRDMFTFDPKMAHDEVKQD
jgi:uncharacterized protein (DUF2344 family)